MNEKYWVVRHKGVIVGAQHPRYWTGTDILGFSNHLIKAVRFSRKEDADAVAQGALKGLPTQVQANPITLTPNVS